MHKVGIAVITLLLGLGPTACTDAAGDGVAQIEEAVANCTNCGFKNHAGAHYCESCDMDLWEGLGADTNRGKQHAESASASSAAAAAAEAACVAAASSAACASAASAQNDAAGPIGDPATRNE